MPTPSIYISSAAWERVLQDLRQCCETDMFAGEPRPPALVSTSSASPLTSLGHVVPILQALCTQQLLRSTGPTLTLPSPLDLSARVLDFLRWELLQESVGWIPLPLVLRKMLVPVILEHALYRQTGSGKTFERLQGAQVELDLALTEVERLVFAEMGKRTLRSLLTKTTHA